MEQTPRYTAAEARQGILKRGLIGDATVPEHVQKRLDQLFDSPGITPLDAVKRILKSVAEGGDAALARWTSDIDGVDISGNSQVSKSHIASAMASCDPDVVNALRIARDRVVAFHKEQPMSSWITTKLGGQLGQLITPIEKVAFYVPGGTAPLPSTVLMSVLPAVVAGTSSFIVLSPPERSTGNIAPVTLAACAIVSELPGVDLQVYRVGGAQAVAAAAFGTETIPQVDKIVGPGNIFVSLAKREVYGVVGIDGIYGPTEAVVLADASASPSCVAADLLAQAEHDFLAVPILITPDSLLADKVGREISTQLAKLARANVAAHSLAKQGGIVVAQDMDECVALCNEFATEHVSLSVTNPWELVPKLKNAGGLFIGEASCEVLGDYIAGPSHVMPTGGSARYAGPLSVLDFVKIISVVALDHETVRKIAPHAEKIAREEGLDGHANAAAIRK